jgi:hypothetical protein
LHSDFDSSDLLASAELKDGNLAGIPVGKVLKKRVTRFGDSHLSPSVGTRIYRSRQVLRSSRPGLGADFIRQLERILSGIVAHPNLEPIREQHDQLRRLIQRSPFGIV